MTVLWIALGVLTAAVLSVIALPLVRRSAAGPSARRDFDIQVYRDQLAEIEREHGAGLISDADADAARTEIERRLLAAADETPDATAAPGGARMTLAGLAVAVPLSAFGLYLMLGSPDAPDQPFAARDIPAEQAARGGDQPDGQPGGGQGGAMDMASAIDRLAAKMKERPDDLDGWLLLGRSYMSQERYLEAAEALGRAYALSSQRPDIGTAYAESLIQSNQGRVTPVAEQVLAAGLKANPKSPTARYYLGLARAQKGDLKTALQDWVDLAALSPDGAPWSGVLGRQITRLAQELGVSPASVKPSDDVLALGKIEIADAPARPAAQSPAAPGGAPGPSAEDMRAAQEMSAEDRQEMIRGMVQGLADRLAEEPNDLAGWRRLERAYRVLGETAKADEAKARIEALSGSGQ